MLLYATDALEASEAAELRTHLESGCPACAGALAEARALVALLPATLDREEAPPSARDRIMAQISSSSRAIAEPRDATKRRGSGMRLFWTAAIAACVGGFIVAAALWTPMRRNARLVESQSVQLVALAGAQPQPQASGKIFWDKQMNDWHVYVYNLRPPAPGKEYELWFITPGQKKVPAGTFTVDASGNATMHFKVPPDLGALALAAVTDEPMGGVQQPTGTVQLVGPLK